jgi:hypothetical protein
LLTDTFEVATDAAFTTLVVSKHALLARPVSAQGCYRRGVCDGFLQDRACPRIRLLTAVDGKGEQDVVGASAEDAAIAGDEEEHPVDERA